MIRKKNLNILRIRKNILSVQAASASGGHTQTNIDLLKVLNFVQETITNALRYKSDPSGNVVNLSQHSFSFYTYKLLNKILISYPLRKDIMKTNSLRIYKISFG